VPLIAAEKAGIIKEGGNVVLYPQAPEADAVIERVCREKNACLYRFDDSDIKYISKSLGGQVFDFMGYKNLRLSMLSGYQCLNAATAVKTAEILSNQFEISEEDIREGLNATRWPGRFELMRREPDFVIDCAHNTQGAARLAESLNEYFPGKKITFVIGVSEDKDYHGIISRVLPVAKRFIATR
jgi:dihydrofolate synthase/folylpolyglutamate synthase